MKRLRNGKGKVAAGLLLVFWVWAGGLAQADMPPGKYLEGKASKTAVILAHGRGQHPDGFVVGSLRRCINEELGMYTLSLEMPDPRAENPDSPELLAAYPEAYQRIQAAIDFFRKEKGVERIYLMGHSMGGRMTTGFLVQYPDSGIVGYIGVGLLGGGPEPINTNLNLKKINIPVIDIYAEADRDAKAAEFRRGMVSERYVQIPISGAKHSYRGYEKPVCDAVNGWLKKQEGK
jgi:predicted alpha/beta-hydrolase family hydrolase